MFRRSLASASVPDFRQVLPKEGRLRRVVSEAGHELRVPHPLIRIRTERVFITPGEDDPTSAATQQSPLRRALGRLRPPVSLSAQFVDLALEPNAQQPRRELSIVFERRSRNHRSRVTVTADSRFVSVLACLALLSTVTAMSGAAVSSVRIALGGSAFGRPPVAPRRANIAPAADEVARVAAPPRSLAPTPPPALANVLDGPAEPLPAFLEALALSDDALTAGLAAPLPPVALARARAAKTLSGQRREAFAGARLSLLKLHAHLLATFALVPAARQRGAALQRRTPAPAPTPAVAWPGGHGRAQRLTLTRHALRLAFELQPLAEGLGCSALLSSLSEASCAVLLPESYKSVHDWHQANDSLSARALAAAKAQLEATLGSALPAGTFAVTARTKSRLSVFDKAVLRGKAVGDLLAARIVLDDDVDCAAVHSLLARLWAEDATRFKDYVTTPKRNGYQSIHATMRLPCGRPLEVQIRTRAMHAAAEHGSACWGVYKADACVGRGDADDGDGARRRGNSFERVLEGVRCLQALQPERLREALACAAAGIPIPAAA